MTYDIIIPVAGKDISFLGKVVKYIRKNLTEAEYVYIITNKKNFNHLFFRKNTDSKVIKLDENEIIPGLTFDGVKKCLVEHGCYVSPGWYLQQFLKLGFATTKYARKYYLSWDSDTLPLSHISFFDDEHPVFTRKKEVHQAYFETIERLLGFKKQKEFSFIAEHMMFCSETVCEMLNEIMQSQWNGEYWYQRVIDACNFGGEFGGPHFSEFETYGTYCTARHPDMYHTQVLNTFRGAGFIRGRHVSDKILAKMALDLNTASFELYDKPLFPYSIPYYVELWRIKFHKAMSMSWQMKIHTIMKKMRLKHGAK